MDFDSAFKTLTGCPVCFPWQRALYDRLVTGDIPAACDIPTGLGKTSVIALWLLALMTRPNGLPRRLAYVVNRRTVVDQTTAEVQRLRQSLPRLEQPGFDTLAISTLRGQFADNGEWILDPSKPAVVCGTVDMIGSRLLFGGYRIGFKSRPLHAGFLGQDTLLVHDEAHLEPAFQCLIEAIQQEQQEVEHTDDLPWPKLRVMALSATTRNIQNHVPKNMTLTLTEAEMNPPEDLTEAPSVAVHEVWKRLKARKSLRFHPDEDDEPAREVVEIARQYQSTENAIVVFLRHVEDVIRVAEALRKETPHVATLTGTMRGYERDELVRSNAVFARFLSSLGEHVAEPAAGAAYLVCTSAGEVGVDLSADHMVCDLTTLDSMIQRLGRVNRRGTLEESRVDIVHPAKFDTKDKKSVDIDQRREKTLAILKSLPDRNACPLHLLHIDPAARTGAFAPEPVIPPVSDILFDKWAMTSIRGEMPGRPPVSPYLHGITEWEPPQTSVAWREEVEVVTWVLIEREGEELPQELLACFPLKPHELLTDRSDRISIALQDMANQSDKTFPVWIVTEENGVVVTSLQDLLDGDRKTVESRIDGATILLPPYIGGLGDDGTLNGHARHRGDHRHGYDIVDKWLDEHQRVRRCRIWDDEESPKDMALVRTIDTNPGADEFIPYEDTPEDFASGATGHSGNKRRFWHWYIRPREAEEVTPASVEPVGLSQHTNAVITRVARMAAELHLPPELQEAIRLAAEFHDLGKRRELWQRTIGNPTPSEWYAKPGKPRGAPRWRPLPITAYRHEFGSLLDALDPQQEHLERLQALSPDMQDVVLHLVAAHHGYARPHFAAEGICDPDYPQRVADDLNVEVMRRYARLQRRFGRWGLAYLESLLRAADWAVSAEPGISMEAQEEEAKA